jgi:2,4-dienoyl-CoA reductase-like NADH-dependent reductase (Old Yellow Enzyme family)/thioredoxin reductase
MERNQASQSAADFPNLLSPLRIGPKTVRNRVLVTAHVPGLAVKGVPREDYAEYHRTRAAGGAGLQITGATPVHVTSTYGRAGAIANLDDEVIPGYRMLADAVQGEGGTILAQLAHYGATAGEGQVGNPRWGPSDIAGELMREQTHAMTKAEIAECVTAFANAAERARKGGLDGVEILAAFGLLIAAFLSPYSNRRTDEFGGALDNRLRFALEITEAVRKAAGPDLIVGMRIPGEEFVEGGLDIGQMKDIARRLEATGQIDYLNVIAGNNMDRVNRATHWPPTPAPHGLFVPLAREIRSVVSLPVFTTGRITDPAMAERIVAEGSADMVGMTRAHIADPEIVRKVTDGRADAIRPCVGANVCIARALQGGAIRCVHNPEAAREREWGKAQPAKAAKTVAVIGGGPGGLEAARVAAERGHRVRLYEAATSLGGQFALRAAIPTWAEFQGVIDWRRRRLEELQVPIELGRRIDPAEVTSLGADVIILATGAEAKPPAFLGDIPVTTPHEFIRNGAGDARTAVIWDKAGGIVGGGAFDAVVDAGLIAHIVTPQFAVAEDIDLIQRIPLYERLLSAGATFHPNSDVVGIEGSHVIVENVYTGAKTPLGPVDLLLTWTGRTAVDDLAEAIRTAGIELHLIGDAVAPRTAEFAIAEGALVGRAV